MRTRTARGSCRYNCLGDHPAGARAAASETAIESPPPHGRMGGAAKVQRAAGDSPQAREWAQTRRPSLARSRPAHEPHMVDRVGGVGVCVCAATDVTAASGPRRRLTDRLRNSRGEHRQSAAAPQAHRAGRERENRRATRHAAYSRARAQRHTRHRQSAPALPLRRSPVHTLARLRSVLIHHGYRCEWTRVNVRAS